MARCTTNHYITADKNDVARLARLDNTPEDKVRCKDGVEPLCVEIFWSYWSDGAFSGKSFSGERPQKSICPISEGARSIITTAGGSDSGLPGRDVLDSLVKATNVREVKEHLIRSRETITEYELDMPGGKKEKLFAAGAGYFEGYMFEIERSFAGAKKYLDG